MSASDAAEVAIHLREREALARRLLRAASQQADTSRGLARRLGADLRSASAACNWLTRAGLLCRLERVLDAETRCAAWRLGASLDAAPWLAGKHQPVLAPTERDLLLSVAEEADALRARGLLGSPEAAALRDALDALDAKPRVPAEPPARPSGKEGKA